jgi:hypothetical protein
MTRGSKGYSRTVLAGQRVVGRVDAQRRGPRISGIGRQGDGPVPQSDDRSGGGYPFAPAVGMTKRPMSRSSGALPTLVEIGSRRMPKGESADYPFVPRHDPRGQKSPSVAMASVQIAPSSAALAAVRCHRSGYRRCHFWVPEQPGATLIQHDCPRPDRDAVIAHRSWDEQQGVLSSHSGGPCRPRQSQREVSRALIECTGAAGDHYGSR